MNDLKFKVSGVGLDTRGRKRCKPDGFNYLKELKPDYVVAGLTENNDSHVKEVIEHCKDSSLILTVNFLDALEFILPSYLSYIGRKNVDLLVIDAKIVKGSKFLSKISTLVALKTVKEVGLMNVGSVDEFKSVTEILSSEGISVYHVLQEICPLNFPYDLIEFYKERDDTMIIGTNPFGGKISANNLIQSFTLPYLLGFSAFYCNAVIVNSDNMYQMVDNMAYLRVLYGVEADSQFVLKKNISKLAKPIKKLVSTSLKIDDGALLPYSDPTELYMYPSEVHYTLGPKATNSVPILSDEYKSEVEKEVYNMLDIFYQPKDGGISSCFMHSKYAVLDLLSAKYSAKDGWGISMVELGNNTVHYFLTKIGWKYNKLGKIFGFGGLKVKDSLCFRFSMPDKNTKIFVEDYITT